MQNPRRRFLALLGTGSLAGSIGFPVTVSADAIEETPHPKPVSDAWDMSWTERLTGKYRAVFDSPEAAEGSALYRAVAWCDMYKEVYGAERQEMSPVVVIRHSAIPLIMGNAYWERFDAGKQLKIKDSKGKWTKTNPISRGAEDATANGAKYKLESFVESGGIVLACNWAFGMIVSKVREKDKLEAAEARVRAEELMLPGVILQPNGIFAALRAQEAGCRYILAS